MNPTVTRTRGHRPVLAIAAIATFLFTTADSCSSSSGTSAGASSGSTSSGGASSGGASSGGGGGSAPEASTITGNIVPRTASVGEQVTITFDLSGFNQDIPDLSLETSGDLHDHNVIDGVTISPQGNAGAAVACKVDPNKSSAYECGPVSKSAQVEVTIIASPKDAGNYSPNILWTEGSVGSSNWQEFGGNNSVMSVTETVNP